jgi:hypothetical protein
MVGLKVSELTLASCHLTLVVASKSSDFVEKVKWTPYLYFCSKYDYVRIYNIL